MAAFIKHPGINEKKPFGFDIHQGFEFFHNLDGKLYRKLPGVMIPLTQDQESELMDNIGRGAVELFVRRPTAGILDTQLEKIVIHAATGQSIPKGE
ncbi:hypothetical protein D3C85_1699200 [compost metagenome]